MKIWQILQSLEGLEDCMARFYAMLSRHYSSDVAVAGFFARMSDEEIAHRDIVRYQQRVMFKAPENYLDLEDYDQDALDQTRRTVEEMITREADLTLDEALRSSVAIENAATQQHYRNVVGRALPALGKLIENLGCCDEDHAAKLGAFARSHGGNSTWWTA